MSFNFEKRISEFENSLRKIKRNCQQRNKRITKIILWRKKMNKHELANTVKTTFEVEGVNYTTTELEAIIDAVFGSILVATSNGEDVNVSGFGKFSTKVRKGKTIQGKIPWMVGKTFTVPDTKFLKFHAAEAVKRFLNPAQDPQ